jgi:hypothetical protein
VLPVTDSLVLSLLVFIVSQRLPSFTHKILHVRYYLVSVHQLILVGTLSDGALWSVIETSSGVISVCLPTLGPLIKACARKLDISRKTSKIYSVASETTTIGGSRGSAYEKAGAVSRSIV